MPHNFCELIKASIDVLKEKKVEIKDVNYVPELLMQSVINHPSNQQRMEFEWEQRRTTPKEGRVHD